MHPLHFRKLVEDTLSAMGPPYDSPAAVELLLLTAAQESKLGLYLWQIKRNGSPGGGPGVGVYQMEPGRFKDTWSRWPEALRDTVSAATGWARPDMRFLAMAWDLRLATAMARAAYWLVKGPLPAADDLDGLDAYYQRGWCRGCKAKPGDAASAYRRYVLRQKEES